jgi:hypothetical protein
VKSNATFLKEAKAGWARCLAVGDDPKFSGSDLAVAVSLWAAMNVDRLLEIASLSQERDTHE